MRIIILSIIFLALPSCVSKSPQSGSVSTQERQQFDTKLTLPKDAGPVTSQQLQYNKRGLYLDSYGDLKPIPQKGLTSVNWSPLVQQPDQDAVEQTDEKIHVILR